MLVDISGIPNVRPGDIAVIIGQSGNEKLYPDLFAQVRSWTDGFE